MTFTVQDPTAGTYPTARQRVREACGDIDATINLALQVPDELIDYWVETFGETRAYVEAIKDCLARYARQYDTGTRSAGLEAERRFERLKQLLEIAMANQRTTVAPGTSVGGAFIAAPYLSKAYGRAARADSDFNQGSKLRVGMNDSDMPDN